MADGTGARLLSTQWPVRRWQVDGGVTLRVKEAERSQWLSELRAVSPQSHAFQANGKLFLGDFRPFTLVLEMEEGCVDDNCKLGYRKQILILNQTKKNPKNSKNKEKIIYIVLLFCT